MMHPHASDRRQTGPSGTAEEATISVKWRVQLRRYATFVAATSIAAAAFALPVATASASPCPNETLRSELGSTQLPDCRAYELVSSTTKYGWPVFVARATGQRVVISSLGGEASKQNSLEIFHDINRTSAGWEAALFEEPPAFHNIETGNVVDETPELDQGLFVLRLASSPFLGERNIYLKPLPGIPGETPQEVGPLISKARLEAYPFAQEEGVGTPSASNDLSRVVFGLHGPYNGIDYLWPGDTTVESEGVGYGFESIYEYRGQTNLVPALVGVNDNGELISQCGTSLGFPHQGQFGRIFSADEGYNAISSDGAHAFFTAAAAARGPEKNHCTDGGAGSGPPVNELFDRVLSSGDLRTVAISEPSNADCEPCNTTVGQEAPGAVFEGASDDGSKVLFLSGQSLLPGAAGEASLYEYNYNARAGARVALLAPNVLGVARLSEDGSHTYFVAKAALTGANREGKTPTAGAANLYLSVLGCPEGGTACPAPTYRTVFIATLSAEADGAVWRQEDERPVTATPDGRFAIFTSSALHLTPDDNGSTAQVFEYDSQAETLTRVSHGQNGFNNDGNTSSYAASIIEPNYQGHRDPASQLGSLSEDGATVAFQSPLGLTPQALDGVRIGTDGHGKPVYAQNVYEWHNGQVYLISDGQDRSVGLEQGPSTSLLGMDSSGQNIFFTTADRLVPQDPDTQRDVYDARVNGGFAAPSVPVCEGEGCQGSLGTQPLLAPVAGMAQPESAPPPGPPVPPSAPRSTRTTTAQRLAAALKACRARHDKHRRKTCERAARRRYHSKAAQSPGKRK
jgi:hypothetical protein